MSKIHKNNDRKFNRETPMDSIRRKFLAKIAAETAAKVAAEKEAVKTEAKEPTK